MKLGTLLYLPKNYPCAKCGYYSLIYDVINVSLTVILKVLHMFVDQVLFRILDLFKDAGISKTLC